MRLTRKQFESKIAQNSLGIALIGMSNIGKSYWAKHIAKTHDFEVFEVDNAIQEHLNLGTIHDTAQWMGHPYARQYKSKAKKYLEIEGNMTLRASVDPKNVVLDTTGSVVHLAKGTLTSIQENYLTVYLQANPENIEVLVERFSSSPKPLIWGNCYKEDKTRTPVENLLACYPNLLKKRAELYENLADITINITPLENATVDFFDVLLEELSA